MALSANTPFKELVGKLLTYLLYQAIHIYEGGMVFRRSDGYATNVAGGNPFLGHAYAEANNSTGASGALEVYVRNGRYQLQVTLASVAITDVGKPVYASDDATLTLTPTGNSQVGQVVKFLATNTCIVEFHTVGEVVASVVKQAHIADAKVNYTTGDLDLEAEIIAAFNTTNAKINALLAALETAQVLADA
jgi:hypothetical protein